LKLGRKRIELPPIPMSGDPESATLRSDRADRSPSARVEPVQFFGNIVARRRHA
jgi:hypothetical protein